MYVYWRLSETASSATYDQEFEVGKDIETYISFSTASDSKSDDKFVFDIADPSIISYTPSSNYAGTFHMNKIGETTVTVSGRESGYEEGNHCVGNRCGWS